MNADPNRSRAPRRRGGPRADCGFTLLEIMVTLAVIGGALVLVLQNREESMMNYYVARDANLARNLARELLSEVSYREPDDLHGRFDGFPDFEYEIEISHEDLVSGETEDGEEQDEYSTGRDWKGDDRNQDSQGAGFSPGDIVENEDQPEYPVRRVKITVRYPNLKDTKDDAEPLKLVIETILPPLPDDEDQEYLTPFGTGGKSGSKSGSKGGRSK